jgi:hypothetical protein
MSEAVDRIRAKVTRAKQHIQDFQLRLRAFYDTNPYEVRTKVDPQAGKRIYYVARADPVPDALAAIAADALQNLHAPLDHIAHQLVLNARGGAQPKKPVHFPFSKSADDYPSRRKSEIQGVRQDVVDAIDATEPYKGGKGHALWQLHQLNVADKHHLLVGAATIASGVDISPDLNAWLRSVGASEDVRVPPLFVREADRQPVKVGYELYIEPIEHEVHKDRQFTFDVAFYQPGVIELEPAMKTLQDFANLVDALVTRFEPFLP